MRLDKHLLVQKIVDSRTKAQDFVQNGLVLVNGTVVTKNSFIVSEQDVITIKNQDGPNYVSRAAHKLQFAIEAFNLDLKDKTMLDIGSSTGGFIQVGLLNGAKNIVGIDVGQGQLHDSFISHPQVQNFEKVNARNPLPFYRVFDIITCDVSFISIALILENILKHLKLEGLFILLVKPQFEIGHNKYKNGIVPLEEHQKIFSKIESILKINSCMADKKGISPIKGKDGNQEYLWVIKKLECNQH
jgi:23S rRNA (cytidine1920-2'-O)/16S rRNA (cytidine1409-2'-O)-methyltransferase